MLGVQLDEHERRYDLGQEWIDLVTRIWREKDPFDFEGEFFQTKGTILDPKPVSGERPMLVAAGTSGRGREFAVLNADMLFHVFYDFEKYKFFGFENALTTFHKALVLEKHVYEFLCMHAQKMIGDRL